jgi:hypothetical protein
MSGKSKIDSGQTCDHYNGVQMLGRSQKKCGAGIDPIYSFCDGNSFGWVNKAPCFSRNADAPICPQAKFPTPSEIAEREAKFNAYLEDFMNWMPKARDAIVALSKASKTNAGTIDCPKCKAELRWTLAPSNGHVHAKCQTEGCLQWME